MVRRQNRWLGVAPLIALALAACAEEPLPPAKVIDVGRVLGSVMDGANGKPVPEATVKLVGQAEITATTTASGGFSLDKVPVPGTYTVEVGKAGYVTRRTNVIFDATPNGTAMVAAVIARPDASVAGVVTTASGLPAANAVLGIDLRADGWDVVATVNSDDTGKYKLDGLPGLPTGLNAVVQVRPFDGNSDGIPEFEGISKQVMLYPAATTPRDFVLGVTTETRDRPGVAGRVVGFVVDAESGSGMTGVKIETRELGSVKSTTTVDGYFVLPGLTAGSTYRLVYTATGYVTRFVDVNVPQPVAQVEDASPVGNAGALQMAKANAGIQGKVEWAGGAVSGASVSVDLVRNGFLQTTNVTTNAQGKFDVKNLPGFPGGFAPRVCVFSADTTGSGVNDFVPACADITTFPNQTTPYTFRLRRTDLATGDTAAVEGLIRDAYTRLPVAGVKVYEAGETFSVTTDESGWYHLPAVKRGTITEILFEANGYSAGYASAFLSGGQVWRNDPWLYKGDARIAGEVIYNNMKPARNAEVRIDLRARGFNVFKTVTTDTLGKFEITGLPGASEGITVQLTVSPLITDPTLPPDTDRAIVNAVVWPGATTPLSIVLNLRRDFGLAATNVAAGIIAPTEPMEVLFVGEAVPAESSVTLVDRSSGLSIDVKPVWSADKRHLTVLPDVPTGVTPNWGENKSFNFTIGVRGTDRSWLARTWVVQTVTLSSSANITNVVTGLTADPATADSSTQLFTLSWNPIPEAWSYRVRARQVGPLARVLSNELLTTTGATPSPVVSVRLPGSFNVYPSAATASPMAGGTKVVFTVVPVDSRGVEAELNKAATLQVADDTVPSLVGAWQVDSVLTGTVSRDVSFVFRFSEVVDKAAAPTLAPPSGWTVKSWAYSTDGMGGTAVITVPANNTNVPADTTLSINGVKDTSGKLLVQTSLPIVANPAITNGTFEGPSCSVHGWSYAAGTACCDIGGTYQGVVRPNVSSRGAVREGSCSLELGDASVRSCGRAPVSTNVDLRGIPTGRKVAVEVPFWPYVGAGSGTQACELYEGSTYIGAVFDELSNARSWQLPRMDVSNYVGKQLTLSCYVDEKGCNTLIGMYIDAVKVLVR